MTIARAFRLSMTVPLAFCMLVAEGCSGIRLERSIHPHPEDWPMYARDPSRSNVADEVISPPLTLAWEQDVSGGVGYGSPLIVDSILVVGTMKGELFAMNGRTGKRYGWVSLSESIQGSPVLDGTRVIVASSDSHESLEVFDLTEGKTEWRRSYGDIEMSPLLYENTIYVGNTAGSFFCVNKWNGDEIWKFEIPDNDRRKGFRSSPAADRSTVVCGADDGTVYAFNSATGKVRWSYQTGASIVAPAAISTGIVYIGNLAGMFYALDLRDGRLLWKFSAGTSIYAGASPAADLVIIGTTGGVLYGLQPGVGSLRWRTDLGGVINSAAVMSGNNIYVGTLMRTLFSVNSSDGRIVWKQNVTGRIKTSPAVGYGKLFIATDEREILAFRGAQQ